jgi:cellulose synthase/poly-beta-1,6-N-acetylglucosamine synthase-like glycosyltransferase
MSTLVFITLTALPALIVCGSLLYLLLLLAASVLPPRRARGAAESSRVWPRLAVVIPAHDEELVLAATLHSLREQDYPYDLFDIVVVADNCSDTTAAIARDWGAQIVLERTDTTLRGKGYALEWAFAQLLASESSLTPRTSLPGTDAFIIVDADTQLAPNFLSVMAHRLKNEAGYDAVALSRVALQGRYGVLNPSAGWRASLMTAAFDLCNHVRLQGAANLGLSVGLKGNGMAFTRALLQAAPWQGTSITEDIDYGLSLLRDHNVMVRYEPAARVWAQMPTDDAPAASQRERWERGRYRLLRQQVPSLLRLGLVRRRIALIAAAIDLTVPPLAELMGLLALWGLFAGSGVGLGYLAPVWLWPWLAAATGAVVYVIAGLIASGAKRDVFLALLHVPAYIAWKMALYITRFLAPARRRRASDSAAPSVDDWVRTERTALVPGLANPGSLAAAVLEEEKSR